MQNYYIGYQDLIVDFLIMDSAYYNNICNKYLVIIRSYFNQTIFNGIHHQVNGIGRFGFQ
jgi:hypothetical protein